MKSQWKWHRLFLSSLIATTITTSLFDTNSYRATANSHQTLSNSQRLSQFQAIGLKKSSGLSTLIKPNVRRSSSRKQGYFILNLRDVCCKSILKI
jgi:hypothetical protein